jgi:hypothetical protein
MYSADLPTVVEEWKSRHWSDCKKLKFKNFCVG